MIRQQFLDYTQGLKQALDAIPTDAAEKFLQLLESAYLDGRQVFLMGNGGSGASASHAAGDLISDPQTHLIASLSAKRMPKVITNSCT